MSPAVTSSVHLLNCFRVARSWNISQPSEGKRQDTFHHRTKADRKTITLRISVKLTENQQMNNGANRQTSHSNVPASRWSQITDWLEQILH